MKAIPFILFGMVLGIFAFVHRAKLNIFLTDNPEYGQSFYLKDLLNRPTEPTSLLEHLFAQVSVELNL